jgi:hypothetical protein
MLLLNPIAGAGGDFTAGVAAWGQQLATDGSVLRVTLDQTMSQLPGGDNAFPDQALLSLWLDSDEFPTPGTPPAGIEMASTLLTEVCESPPELLRELYQPDAG